MHPIKTFIIFRKVIIIKCCCCKIKEKHFNNNNKKKKNNYYQLIGTEQAGTRAKLSSKISFHYAQ